MLNLNQLNFKRILPLAGIVAFSLCSCYSLYQLFNGMAKHPTWLFAIPAILTEVVTAWVVYQSVEQIRRITLSHSLKQDRRFYAIILALFVTVAIPTLAASVWANTLEFGSVLLGLLFPMASIGCAIGVALPDVIEQHRRRKQADEEARKQAIGQRKQERKSRQEVAALLATMGNEGATLRQLAVNPRQSLSTIAQSLSISRQAVSKHVSHLEQLGAIRRNGSGTITVLWDVRIIMGKSKIS